MDIGKMFEDKRQELGKAEQRVTFLRGQLEEAERARLQLVGQLTAIQEVAQAIEAEQAAAEQVAAGQTEADTRLAEISAEIDRVPRGRPREMEVANGRDDT